MATITYSSIAHGFNPSGFIANSLKQISRRYAQRSAYTQTLRELEALSPRDLADLGISQYDIKKIAREHAYT